METATAGVLMHRKDDAGPEVGLQVFGLSNCADNCGDLDQMDQQAHCERALYQPIQCLMDPGPTHTRIEKTTDKRREAAWLLTCD